MAVMGELIGRASPEAWRSIRRRRADPPIKSTEKARIATFRASLEQAEQQFIAAATISYDSRPLNLFYGLSQAGRAVAAASSKASGADWLLEGHGIVARNLDRASSVGDVQLFSSFGEKGSFQRLSRLLHSPAPAGEHGKGAVPGAMSTSWHVADCWPYLVETQYSAELNPGNLFVPLGIVLPPTEIARGGVDFPHGASSAEVAFPRLSRIEAQSRPTPEDFLDHYPTLRTRTSIDQVWGDYQARLSWVYEDDTTPPIWHDSFTLYRGQRYAFPGILPTGDELHPLMAWWSVLFALSMLARYQPDRWTKMINVDGNPQATALEYVLDLALSAVPDLIDETLSSVSA
jgi:hypothetical protein